MKQYIIIFVLLYGFATQVINAQRFNGGLAAGLCGSQVDGDNHSGYNKVGLFAGGFVNYPLSQKSALQMEMDFIQKGSRYNPTTENPDDYSLRINISYIEVPLLYQYIYNDKFTFEAGPAFSVLIQHYEEFNYREVTEPFRSTNWSLVAGISYTLWEGLKANFRTNQSITSIRKGESNGYIKRFFGGYGQYNNVLVLSLQIHIRSARE